LDPAYEILGLGRTITHQNLKMPHPDSFAVSHRSAARLGPAKISVSRLPITGSDVFGREEDIAFLNDAWSNQQVNVVTIIAWAGVGKSTLVNHWLARMAAENYRSAERVFGWSFYRQGTSGGTSSADEFLDVALTWLFHRHLVGYGICPSESVQDLPANPALVRMAERLGDV
jgi:hypothetical protein